MCPLRRHQLKPRVFCRKRRANWSKSSSRLSKKDILAEEDNNVKENVGTNNIGLPLVVTWTTR